MPQMAPLNWLTLYFYFFFLFLFMIIMNYYLFFYTPKFNLTKMKKKFFNWKW